MASTARERVRAYLRWPRRGDPLAPGIVMGAISGVVIVTLGALTGVSDRGGVGGLLAYLGLAVVVGLALGLAFRAWAAWRRPRADGPVR